MKTVLLGGDSFIARHVARAFREHGGTVLETSRRADRGDRPFFDLEKPDVRGLSIDAASCDAAVITGGATRIKECHEHPRASRRVNVEGTLETVKQLDEVGLKAVVFSSDYVFDGTVGAYDERSPLSPCTEYGRQKADLERFMAELGGRHLVVRLCKVYSGEKGDGTIFDEMAQRLVGGGTIQAASDQSLNPLHSDDLSRALLVLLSRDVRGLINVCPPGAFTRYQMAVRLAEALGVETERVRNISIHDLDPSIRRPENTSMVCGRIREIEPFTFTSIEDGIFQAAENWRASVVRS